jgi:8-oxo-dGTP diphosphatase
VHLATTSEYGDVRWYPVDALPKLAYDHKEIIAAAIERLRSKLGYTNIVYGVMPRYFTLTELQRVYEIILRRTIDKRNFRKKILALGLLKKTNRKMSGLRHRPAELYEFAVKKPQTVNVMKI